MHNSYAAGRLQEQVCALGSLPSYNCRHLVWSAQCRTLVEQSSVAAVTHVHSKRATHLWAAPSAALAVALAAALAGSTLPWVRTLSQVLTLAALALLQERSAPLAACAASGALGAPDSPVRLSAPAITEAWQLSPPWQVPPVCQLCAAAGGPVHRRHGGVLPEGLDCRGAGGGAPTSKPWP